MIDKNKIILDNYSIIVDYVNKYHNKYNYLFDSKEDMIQEIVIHLLDKLDNYNNSISKISTYIYIIINNYIKNKLRYYYNNKEYINNIYNNIEEKEEEEYYNFINKIYNKDILERIKDLLIEESILYYLYDISITDISVIKGITKQAISKKIKENINNIKNILDLG